jgi:hypothetical protein
MEMPAGQRCVKLGNTVGILGVTAAAGTRSCRLKVWNLQLRWKIALKAYASHLFVSRIYRVPPRDGPWRAGR